MNHFFPVTHTITQIFFNSNLFIHVNIIQKTNSAYEYSNTMEAIDIFLHKPSSFNALPFHCNFSLRFTRNRHSIFSCQIISLFISFLAIVRCTRIKKKLKQNKNKYFFYITLLIFFKTLIVAIRICHLLL